MKNLKLVLLLLSLNLLACSKVLIKPNTKNTPVNCYTQFYEDLKNKYVFFDYKRINWDSINNIYAPQINNDMANGALFQVLRHMIAPLKDGHTSIFTPTDTFKYLFYEGSNENFNASFISNTYLTPNHFNTTETITHCLLNGNIGYMHYPSFKNDLTENGMNAILNTYSNTKGLIIDIRHNTGGSNDNIYRLLEHFVTEKTLLGYYQEKASSKINDLTAPYPIYIEPRGTKYTKPIVVLTNSRVFSSANIFSGFISQLAQVKLMGDKTGGGSGAPTSNQLPNGWLYRFTSTVVTLSNHQQFENGVLPDIIINTGALDEAMGKDAIIERAILELQ
jgi:Peptidase family S41/Tricorn protease C1 domain